MQVTTFYRHENDTVTVSHWDYDLIVSKDLIQHADPRYIRCAEGFISIVVDNGQAVYRIAEEDEARYALVLVSSEINTRQPMTIEGLRRPA